MFIDRCMQNDIHASIILYKNHISYILYTHKYEKYIHCMTSTCLFEAVLFLIRSEICVLSGSLELKKHSHGDIAISSENREKEKGRERKKNVNRKEDMNELEKQRLKNATKCTFKHVGNRIFSRNRNLYVNRKRNLSEYLP